MSIRSIKRERGFSLLEMVVATAIGTVVVGAAAQLYVQGVSATLVVSQRAEMQQDFRAASNMLTKDLSLAGAGLNPGAAIALPTSSTIPVYGCDQSNTCYINSTSVQYPQQSGTPYLYGLLTGYNLGPTISGQTTDAITVAYTDPSFYLNCYDATIASATRVTFALDAASSNCSAPSSGSIQSINDSAVGLTAGDLVLFYFGTTPVVAEVFGTAPTSTTVTFAASDPLKMNQGSAVPKSVAYQFTQPTKTGYGVRLLVITYYLDNTVSPSRLMRQISGHTPMPVAESAVYMKFTYDLFNTNTNSIATQCQNPGATGDVCYSGTSSGLLPNQVTKINIANMAMDSTVKSSMYGLSKGDQSIDLQTSVSTRNLTYVNNYNN
jgi:prepilin-type N-terminal cleavage/methylation domain-containing protein